MEKNKQNIRRWILFFIICLVISGATAIPVEAELSFGVIGFIPLLICKKRVELLEKLETEVIIKEQIA